MTDALDVRVTVTDVDETALEQTLLDRYGADGGNSIEKDELIEGEAGSDDGEARRNRTYCEAQERAR